MEKNKYDAIIIGSGQAGNPLMFDLSKRGKKVALVEMNKVGGSCINFGCTPTKTLIASSNLYHRVQTSHELGISVGKVELDFKNVMKRKNEIVNAFKGTIENAINRHENITLYRGKASFIDKSSLKITHDNGQEQIIQGEKIYIDVGSKPTIVPIDGLKEVKYLDSTSIMELTELPKHLVIIGTSYIALEFGQMFKRFGSKVTMIGRGDYILKKEDKDVSDRIQEILEEDGIKFMLNSSTEKVENNYGKVKVFIKSEQKKETIECSHLMLAVGRDPLTKDLGLESAGVEIDDRGYIKVDEKLKTTADNIYALGDVKGGPAFTHIAHDDYRIIIDHEFGEGKRSTKDRLVPFTLYTEPQLGRVGLTETQAIENGYDVKIGKLEMRQQGRAVEENYTKGFMKAVINKEDDKILGVSILGYQGGEIMAIVEVAMMAGMTYDKLRDAVFSHPSLSEILNYLFDI